MGQNAVAGSVADADREVLADLARSLSRTMGLGIALYDPQGVRLAGEEVASNAPAPSQEGDGAAPREDASLDPWTVGRLVRSAAESGRDRVEATGDRMLAAWPVRRRGRTRLVAVASVAGDPSRAIRPLLIAAGEAVRARLSLAEAQAATDSLSEALSQSYEEVSLLHGLAEVLRVTQPVREMVADACRELRACIGAEAVAAWVPDLEARCGVAGLISDDARSAEEAKPETAVEATPRGVDEPTAIVAGSLPFEASDLPLLVEQVFDGTGAESHLLINNRCQSVPDLAALSPGLERLVLVPLPLGDGVRGALLAANREDSEFGSPDAKLVRSVAAEVAVFIENHRLYRDLQDLMLDLVRALVSSIDAKDPYTCGHSERVATASRAIARRMGLSEERSEEAYLAGLLHDIGKIGTPERILCKEGRLDAEERQIIHEHPAIGARILSTVKHLQPIREAVLHHHERIDGSGYPEGLEGEAISLLGRIVGLADAFDAMTSNRPYRPKLAMDHVVKEIEHNVGTQFDVRAADALLGLDLAGLMQQFARRRACPTVPEPVAT